MTVAELIDALSEYPPDTFVYMGRQVDRRVRIDSIGWVGMTPAPFNGHVLAIAWRDPARNLGTPTSRRPRRS